ncbi:MAG TPA: YggS family pyridoxal phosphate-dependent enzyme [Myxococcales bacterium]|nr:YggS family pyridoxal phosphate-dependent enzyme [Myxococcales bacterium]
MSIDVAAIQRRLGVVRNAVRRAAAGRADVTLIAVSKGHVSHAIRAAYEAGQRDFGESYPQEWRTKSQELADLSELRWHFIGHLQRNKTQWVAGQVALHHAVNSLAGLETLARRSSQSGRIQDVLLQVNLAAEATKRGCAPDEIDTYAQALLGAPGLRWRGLMTLPPQDGSARVWFGRLRDLRDRLRSEHQSALHAADCSLDLLSMGMSGDFREAIEEGATHVRVGTAIFGPRGP